DDEASSRKLLAAILRKWGYDVVSASDGKEALAILESEEPPRIALLDWLMPGLDGLEVCERVRRLEGGDSAYLILLTALGKKENTVKGLRAGADDYITKPFDTEELRARIKVGERILHLRTDLARQVLRLEEALAHIKTLQGIIPICMHCHRIRDDEEVWQRIEGYLERHSEARFRHGLCPTCLKKHYPETVGGTGPG
ncbi:MAG: response regulator, partial [Planctomycetota bacterium]